MSSPASIVPPGPPSADSRRAMQHKLDGGELDEAGYRLLLGDFIEGRYSEAEIAAFLCMAVNHLGDAEVLALARVRASFDTPIEWHEPIVVDKHSMGGVPGSRITMILVPIVAAHGLAMPKTSSRAITSAAGTADAMETLARVDLNAAEVRRCVAGARACIAWNGLLNHSIIDDVMNAITRPLGLASNRWSVASILSKKVTAGSTHVIVDLPCGPGTKLPSRDEAQALAALFEKTGAGLGLHVAACVTDGSRPIGRGIGPALEVRDVLAVLRGQADAPADLREKALYFASRILAWDPSVSDLAAGRKLSEHLLASGAALEAFERIVDAQGRHAFALLPSGLAVAVLARRGGVVRGIDGWHVASIARAAGAPLDPCAGVDLLVGMGQQVAPGDVLYRVHASDGGKLAAARRLGNLVLPVSLV